MTWCTRGRARPFAALVLALASEAIGCGRARGADPSSGAIDAIDAASSASAPPTPATSAHAATAPSASAEKTACAPLKVTLPEIRHADFDVPVPAIDDPKGTLTPFFRKLARVVRGTAKDHVRIAFFGDSNMTADFISGEARRVFQAQFGDAGHGWVATAKPWFWYQHRDVEHGVEHEDAWEQLCVSTTRVRDGFVGFAGIAEESRCAGGVTWVATTHAKDAPIGTRAQRADVFYLKQPRGGAFGVRVDGVEVRVVETAAPAREPASVRVELGADAPHRIAIAPKGPTVRLYGVALEREVRPSVVVDSLGVGSLNAKQMLDQDEAADAAGMRLRGYDLVIELTGTNVLSLRRYGGWVEQLVARWHAALPDAGVILMSPPDRALSDDKDDETAAVLGEDKRRLCEAGACAYWDFRGAMGGKLSMVKFRDHGWAGGDLTHITGPGGAYMGGRVAYAILEGLAKAAERDPTIGCE